MALTAKDKKLKNDAATLAAVRAASAAGHGEVASPILSAAIKVWRWSVGSGQWQIDAMKIAPLGLLGGVDGRAWADGLHEPTSCREGLSPPRTRK